MAEIRVEKKPRGGGGWRIFWWVIGLAALGAAIWAAVTYWGGNGRVAANNGVGYGAPAAETGPAVNGGTGTGTGTEAGTMAALPVSQIANRPADWKGKTVSGTALVTRVVGFRSFWISDMAGNAGGNASAGGNAGGAGMGANAGGTGAGVGGNVGGVGGNVGAGTGTATRANPSRATAMSQDVLVVLAEGPNLRQGQAGAATGQSNQNQANGGTNNGIAGGANTGGANTGNQLPLVHTGDTVDILEGAVHSPADFAKVVGPVDAATRRAAHRARAFILVQGSNVRIENAANTGTGGNGNNGGNGATGY